MEIVMIRHFATEGNLKKQYIGWIDEPVDRSVLPLYDRKNYPKADRVIASPMIRCRQTAALIAPGVSVSVQEMFRERDFGPFEKKTYEQLKESLPYRKWIGSDGEYTPPGMEDKPAFQNRCVQGAKEEIRIGLAKGEKRLLFVVHGGTIMEILSAMEKSGENLYSWHVKNGNGFLLQLDERAFLRGERCLKVVKRLDYV